MSELTLHVPSTNQIGRLPPLFVISLCSKMRVKSRRPSCQLCSLKARLLALGSW